MRILVTGVNGFVGRHLASELDLHGHTVIAFEHPNVGRVDHTSEAYFGDICDPDAVMKAVRDAKPEACVHLAAIAFVPAGNSDPEKMIKVNVDGTSNLLNAIKDYDSKCRTLVVSTAHVYGQVRNSKPITEEHELAPASVYARSKAEADTGALAYGRDNGLHVMTARPHNHIGPGQSSKFVVPSFAEQAKAIAEGAQDPVMKVGNLDSMRDFTDVRDIVRAYRLLLETGIPGNAYNIASDNLHRIGDVLQMLLDLAGVKPEVTVDEDLYRPTDSSANLDTGKLKKDTGWKPEIKLEQTLADIYNSIQS